MPLNVLQPDNPSITTVNYVVATGAVTFPLWRDFLHSMSSVAADILPILGVLWLSIQMACHFIDRWHGKK